MSGNTERTFKDKKIGGGGFVGGARRPSSEPERNAVTEVERRTCISSQEQGEKGDKREGERAREDGKTAIRRLMGVGNGSSRDART